MARRKGGHSLLRWTLPSRGKIGREKIGRFAQMPPAFSAKKIHGRPAYELARKKEPVELKAVEVELYEYRLTGIDGNLARFVIECSSGTYIRSLAHEMGQQLGCGAHLAEIKRTAVGEFSIEQAIKLEELAEASRAGKFANCLIPLEALLPNFPRIDVLPVIEKRVRHGSKFNIIGFAADARTLSAGTWRDARTGWRRAEAPTLARLRATEINRYRGSRRAAHLPTHCGL
jgi:tRNA U55 pseudouridine synthase TruB